MAKLIPCYRFLDHSVGNRSLPTLQTDGYCHNITVLAQRALKKFTNIHWQPKKANKTLIILQHRRLRSRQLPVSKSHEYNVSEESMSLPPGHENDRAKFCWNVWCDDRTCNILNRETQSIREREWKRLEHTFRQAVTACMTADSVPLNVVNCTLCSTNQYWEHYTSLSL